jgi:hypothetical protein
LRRSFAIALVVITACGNGGSPGATPDASTPIDATTDATIDADAAIADAGPDIDQDPDVYPAKHMPAAQIDDLGGPVIEKPRVVTITFAGDSARDALRAFDDSVVTSAYWTAALAEYRVGAGTSGGWVELPDTVSGKDLTDSDVQSIVENAIASGAAPAPDARTIYVAHFPPAARILYNNGAIVSCIDFAAYHGAFMPIIDAGVSEIVYAAVVRCGADPSQALSLATVATSHVLAEAATDPHPDSAPTFRLSTNDPWKLAGGSAHTDEVGDLCTIFRVADAGPDGAMVQTLWSNRAAAEGGTPCQPAAGSAIGFGASVRTSLETIGLRKSYGYLVVPRGGHTDAIVDVFSAAPLPNDLTLLAGVAVPGSPSMMNAIPDGISATLSRTRAHNGNGVVLTIAAPATAAGQYPFVVRALLDDAHYFDWPVIALVR